MISYAFSSVEAMAWKRDKELHFYLIIKLTRRCRRLLIDVAITIKTTNRTREFSIRVQMAWFQVLKYGLIFDGVDFWERWPVLLYQSLPSHKHNQDRWWHHLTTMNSNNSKFCMTGCEFTPAHTSFFNLFLAWKNLISRNHFIYAPSQWETTFNVTSSLIGWVHTCIQNDPWISDVSDNSPVPPVIYVYYSKYCYPLESCGLPWL